MEGLMMHRPLLQGGLLDFAADSFPDAEIVSRRVEGDTHRESYAEARERVTQLSFALEHLGVEMGDRVATLAWNGYRHFELYYAIPGIGAVCHTINPRLSPEQMIYIIRHAEDKVIFTDLTFVPMLEKLQEHLPPLHYVIMTDRAHMPQTSLDALCYEDLLQGHPTRRDWPEFAETTASGLCYTSGTTGDPKGVLYSHRSNMLHALSVATVLGPDLHYEPRILPVVPLFHVNAWGLPFTAPLIGGSLIMPGPFLDGASLWDLCQAERVETAWGVPTIWQGLYAEIGKRGHKPDALRHMVVGGSAMPRSLIENYEKIGVDVNHAWGMTETSPLGSQGALPVNKLDAPFEERMALKSTQGKRVFGVDMKIVDEDGKEMPQDGEAMGELYVRGNTIMGSYYKNEAATRQAIDADGWFGTGDVASISASGRLVLRDRAKDLIKSGGEWISSIDVENMALMHPKIAQCAIIALPHPKWDERPLLVVKPADPADPPTLNEVNEMLSKALARWQLPDDLVLVDELPLTATGKVSKLSLRQRFKDHVLPDLAG
ncbi:long-chain fatty acid--CoA ligase [Paracoccus fistulariae]|uniref:Long-chain fatty acid--CoA ligase n=1 Tax=Paracoccus fistulariae TaxID=658446 RepID=A0ABY7SMA3_9RHOB|nr:long-chain fatty acid--CoA ligase [Paracoccus fistulariae]MDB6179919.1 long-chain fatty acid--CoA ligase [Paracoccus fistulariae]WCR08019.1 long-chain fatty acid--CoA ligase [Paracoccus fistulariae]